MSYQPDADANTGLFSSMPGKKMALLVVIIIIGGFFGVQAMFGFPIKDLIRSDVTDQEKVVTKSERNMCCNRIRPTPSRYSGL